MSNLNYTQMTGTLKEFKKGKGRPNKQKEKDKRNHKKLTTKCTQLTARHNFNNHNSD